jgi:hypothetical protein
LLAEFDAGAADYVEEKQSILRPLFPGAEWGEFEKMVQNYSFGEAQVRLEQAVTNSSML